MSALSRRRRILETRRLIRDQDGKVRAADGGTLFLDEIGDMTPAAQAKLLRVLQEGVVEPVGGGEVKVDVRVVAAVDREVVHVAHHRVVAGGAVLAVDRRPLFGVVRPRMALSRRRRRRTTTDQTD